MSSVKFQTSLMNLQNNLLSFAYMLTSNRKDAYDLLQDTTLKALDNEEKYAENTNFKGWVFTIMRNLFINNYRKSTQKTLDRTSDKLYLISISRDASTEIPEDSMEADKMTTVINEMSEEYREPFSMHVAGYRYQEIADHLHLPVAIIKERIAIAGKSIRTRI